MAKRYFIYLLIFIPLLLLAGYFGKKSRYRSADATLAEKSMSLALKNLVTAEENFAKDSAHFTKDAKVLHLSPVRDVTGPEITVGPGYWFAVVGHKNTKTRCAISVNWINPLDSTANDSQPGCRRQH